MKRTGLNLILALILIGLGLAVYFSQKKTPPPKPPLTALKQSAIHSISLTAPKHPTVTLSRNKAGHWALTAPVKVAADQDNVNSLLSIATLPCQTKIPLKGLDLKNFGLASPKYTLVFDKTARIEAGAVEPLKYRRYVKTGNHVCLITDPSSQALKGDYSSLVSQHLVPKGRTITAIDLPGTKVSRSADGKHWTVTPADPKMAQDAPQKLAANWVGATSSWNKLIPKGRKVDAGKDTVTLHYKNGPSTQFVIVKRKPMLVLDRKAIGIRYTLTKLDVKKLLRLAPAPVKKKAAAKKGSHESSAKSTASAPAKH